MMASAYADLNGEDREIVDKFFSLSAAKQREVLSALVNFEYSEDVPGDLEDIMSEVK